MLLPIPGVLKADELALARAWLAGAHFVDGKLSAGAAARRVKENEELDRGEADIERLDRVVMGALSRHPAYRNGALPLHAASPLYARYRPGMTYGDHLDDPIMGTGGVMYRSDVAVTVFLNAPEEYDGGELVIRTAPAELHDHLVHGRQALRLLVIVAEVPDQLPVVHVELDPLAQRQGAGEVLAPIAGIEQEPLRVGFDGLAVDFELHRRRALTRNRSTSWRCT